MHHACLLSITTEAVISHTVFACRYQRHRLQQDVHRFTFVFRAAVVCMLLSHVHKRSLYYQPQLAVSSSLLPFLLTPRLVGSDEPVTINLPSSTRPIRRSKHDSLPPASGVFTFS